jgi:hypothetical protein
MARYRRNAQRAAQQVFSSPKDQQVFLAQMNQEAGFEDRTSPAGAQGPAQIMPATAAGWGVHDVHNPDEAYTAAARHMKQYLREYGGDWSKALTAYNAGPGAVGRAQLPAETRNYIRTILGAAGSGSGQAASPAPRAAASQPETQTVEQPSFDQAGYDQAKKRALVGQMLARHHHGGVLFRTGLLSTTMPTPADFQTMQQVGVPTQAVARPGTSTASVAQAIERANTLDKRRLPYVYGGGHAGTKALNPATTSPLDCSSAVSTVLGISPRVSGNFQSWGSPGRAPGGRGITVYSNPEHVLMEINGHFFGTSHANPNGGAGWIPASAISPAYLSRFTARHMAGSR